MSLSPARATALIATGVIAAAGLAFLSPAAQAVPGGGQPTELDYECDTVNVEKIEGKSGHFKLTGTGNCEAHNQLPAEGKVDPDASYDVGPREGEKFWGCDGAKGGEVSKAKIAFNDCTVGVPQ
ncbi:hypothetical protein ACIBCD_37910 [Nocardia brasiliensis]|uniref:hypothetical protein n=1 Tax=Nocardia brasiliensis TaxID=37326 RepID=UPI0037B3AB1C